MALANPQPQTLATERVLGALYRLTVGRLLTWRDAVLTRKSLSQLSNAELHDIGLERGDIDRIAERF